MSRFALLIPPCLGLLIACDGAAPTSPYEAKVYQAAASQVAEDAVFDVQPLGWLDSAVVNATAGGPVTVALYKVPSFFEAVDLESLAFFDAAPLHLDWIAANPLCHVRTQDIYAVGEDGLPAIVETVDAVVLHFRLDLEAYGDGAVETMCLTGNFLETDLNGDPVPFPATWCAQVTIINRGSGAAGK